MRYLFLLNPAAGRQDCTGRLRLQAEGALRRAGVPEGGWDIRRTEYRGHARALAEAAAREGGPLYIFAAGGDGTFREALEGAQGWPQAAVGCIPTGSGNDFLRTFGTRADFLDLDAQLAGHVVSIDLMQTSLGLSASVCAAGLDAGVAAGAAAFRHNPLFHGEAAYLLSALRQLCGPVGRQLRLELDGETIDAGVTLCAACNTRDYGGGFRAAPLARPDDGLIDFVAVRKISRLTLLRLLGRYKRGGHFAGEGLAADLAPYLIYRRVRQVRLAPTDGRGPLMATADGECAPVNALEIRILPAAARVVLPAGVAASAADGKCTMLRLS